MMGDRKNQNLNIPMCMAFVLLFLTLISIHMTSGLFARYTAVSSGSDSARVAAFNVVGDIQADESADQEGAFVLTVTNQSEVAVSYSVAVSFDAPLNVTLDEKEGTQSADKKTVTFSNVGELAPGANPAEHKLQLAVSDWSYFTQNATGSSTSEELDFTVDITAEQID